MEKLPLSITVNSENLDKKITKFLSTKPRNLDELFDMPEPLPVKDLMKKYGSPVELGLKISEPYENHYSTYVDKFNAGSERVRAVFGKAMSASIHSVFGELTANDLWTEAAVDVQSTEQNFEWEGFFSSEEQIKKSQIQAFYYKVDNLFVEYEELKQAGIIV